MGMYWKEYFGIALPTGFTCSLYAIASGQRKILAYIVGRSRAQVRIRRGLAGTGGAFVGSVTLHRTAVVKLFVLWEEQVVLYIDRSGIAIQGQGK